MNLFQSLYGHHFRIKPQMLTINNLHNLKPLPRGMEGGFDPVRTLTRPLVCFKENDYLKILIEYFLGKRQ